MIKRAVIFDFGGVLMKTVDYTPRHHWDDRLGLPRGAVESIVHGSAIWHKAQIGAVPVEAYWDAVGVQLGLAGDELLQLRHDFYAGDQLDQKIIDSIQRLRAKGHTVALLSNDSPELLGKLRLLGIDHLFTPLLISANLGVMKPDPAAYHAALEALQQPAAHCIFIDDRHDNVKAAQQLGIHAVLYRAGMDLCAALEPLLEFTP